ncbi:phosphate ABC transporter substrate-binding protein [Thermodesulfovibrionales bacterium]|nr:phosphate ABC transporter substrate-binding protein [Thermodesulfovibrionales bacterium]
MMKKLFLLLAGLVLIFTPAIAQAGERLVVAGSTTVLPIVSEASAPFMERHPDIRVSVRGGGSSAGIAAFIDGVIDIATSSRPMTEAEIKRAREKGIDPLRHAIAGVGNAIIVHPANPVSNLSSEQIKGIFTGEIVDWREVGGSPKEIVVVRCDHGPYHMLRKLMLEGQEVRPDALIRGPNVGVGREVAGTEGAIGTIAMGFLGPATKAVTIDGTALTTETVRDGTYPLTILLYLYTDGVPAGAVKAFVDFMLSAEGQRIVYASGFVPVK